MFSYTTALLGLALGLQALATPVELTPTYNIKRADALLGHKREIECHPNGLANAADTVTASAALVDHVGKRNFAPEKGHCFIQSSGRAVVSVCNKGGFQNSTVSPEAVGVALDALATECTSKGASGSLRATDGLVYESYYKNGVGRRWGSQNSLAKRQCSNGNDILVNGCSTPVCDPKITLSDTQNCPNVGGEAGGTDGCTYYCELNLAKFYGPPQRFPGVNFCQGTDCYLELSESHTLEVSAAFNFGIEGAGPLESVLSAGISIGVAWSTTTGTTQGFATPEGACGWWTIAPIRFESCGQIGEFEPNFGGYGPLLCASDAPPKQEIYNACSEGQALLTDGSPDEVMVFELADCSTREIFPIESQSDSYKSAYGPDAAQGPGTC